jgi:O-acetylhomoserine (thiol)-lyase
MSNDEPGFSTLSIHAGARPDRTAGARGAPIDPTAAFVFDDVDGAVSLFAQQAFGDVDARIANPTTAALEERVAALEGAPAAVAVASGRAARAIAFHSLMQPGDEFVAATKRHGGSINAFAHAFTNFGWQVKGADPDDLDAVKAAVGEKTKAIFVESIANPGGGVTDIAAIAGVAKAAKIPLIVDNTLATPYLIRPIDHGADIVVHSATTYLGGCGHAMGGVIVDGGTFEWRGDARYPMLSAPRPECDGVTLAESFGNCAFAMGCRALGLRDLGPTISPFASFLILAGIETLSLRMQRHCDNALAVARHLQSHARVGWVSYAGLPDSRYRELARRYCPKGAGGVFAFGVRGGHAAGVALAAKLRLFSHGAAVGGARSLAIHPASTACRQLGDAQKAAAGAAPDAVRLSIGLEDVADLIADLDQALG